MLMYVKLVHKNEHTRSNPHPGNNHPEDLGTEKERNKCSCSKKAGEPGPGNRKCKLNSYAQQQTDKREKDTLEHFLVQLRTAQPVIIRDCPDHNQE